MSQPAVVVEQLGKRYHIGRAAPAARSWRGMLWGFVQGHLQRLRMLREEGDDADTIWALRDASFTVQPGEIVGVIGSNGSGKSTLLKILSRVVTPTTGRAVIHGRVGSLLEVGTGFHPELTGRENIFLNGAILGMRRAEIQRVFDEIVAFSEIGRFLDTPVKRYSSGMYVRLAFAVAAHLRAEIMIVDEVLAVGDAQFQRKCLGKMSAVAQGGRTVLFVSHNMRAVTSLCSRALLLSQGRLVADGPVEPVVAQYLAQTQAVEGAAEAVLQYPDDASQPERITRVAVCDRAGAPTCLHRLDEPVTVEVDYVLTRDVDDLVLVMQVRSPLDEIVLLSTDADRGNHAARAPQSTYPRRAGRYRARVTLPAPLLNAGTYGLVLRLTSPRQGVRASVRGPQLQITDVNTFAAAPFQKSRPGVLAVPLPWEIEHVHNDALAAGAAGRAAEIAGVAR